jgi:hypothetical protein
MDERDEAEEGEAVLAGTADEGGEGENMDDTAAEELAEELDTAIVVGEEEGPAALLAELLVDAGAALDDDGSSDAGLDDDGSSDAGEEDGRL